MQQSLLHCQKRPQNQLHLQKNTLNCTDLNKVYPNGVQEGHPAYDKKMDRDGDGWACEK
ncbi:excalibur calcium-binding domain-containing protein [Lysinibacillus sphaericus]|uniref:excalibur calcium-binding domain-containing protein n=1 Tax=Lysinibacillus sphaericus TaxID=1421 RepID=UPI003D3695F7